MRSRLSKLLDSLLSERRILSVMFIDIVNSTVLAVEMGDERWSDKLERFRAVVRRALDNFGGIEIDTGLLISGVVRDLVAGSRIGLIDRGDHPLKGLPGTFRLYGLAH